jgi:hypothetical protein
MNQMLARGAGRGPCGLEAISGRGAAIAGNIARRPRPDPPMALPRPVHVAHVIHRLDYGGLENGVVNLVNGLPAETVRHTLICLTTASDFRRRIRRPDVAVYELRKQPGQDPGAYLRLWRLLRRLAPDVVHTRITGVPTPIAAHHPINGGNAPGTAPISVLIGVTGLLGV